MKITIPGRCAIYFNRGQLVLNTTYEGDISDENAYENVRYEERDGKLYIQAEQLRPVLFDTAFSGRGTTEKLDDLHPSRINTKYVRPYWWWPFGAKTKLVRYARSGWQRLKDNEHKSLMSTSYTIITSS